MNEIQPTTELIPESELYKISKDIFGFNAISGLPCGELRHFISESATDSEVLNIKASNEREAVGIACGSWLAGKTPALYMQNSGLFESSNDIGSLLIPSKSPVLFIVSWRGAPGETATQHLHTGAATTPLLEAFNLPYITDVTEKKLLQLKEEMDDAQRPGFVLIKREKFNETPAFLFLPETKANNGATVISEGKGLELSRESAIDAIFELLNSDDAVISSTGLISRSIFQNHDADNQFYNAGAFGLTSLIGLGFVMNKPEVRTVVIEGDGSVLTNLSSLNTIANSAPANFVHIVLDNKVYASCSGEKTYGSEIIPLVARDFGYRKVFVIQSPDGISSALSRANNDGPTLIDIQINTSGVRDLKRPLDMDKIAERFRNKFSKI